MSRRAFRGSFCDVPALAAQLGLTESHVRLLPSAIAADDAEHGSAPAE